MLHLGHNGCARRFGGREYLGISVSAIARRRASEQGLPVPALYIRAMLSMLPIMKYEASGDQERS